MRRRSSSICDIQAGDLVFAADQAQALRLVLPAAEAAVALEERAAEADAVPAAGAVVRAWNDSPRVLLGVEDQHVAQQGLRDRRGTARRK